LPMDKSPDQLGTSPQRNQPNCNSTAASSAAAVVVPGPSSELLSCRAPRAITTMSWVGAMLYRGCQSSAHCSKSIAGKSNWAQSAGAVFNVRRPHMEYYPKIVSNSVKFINVTTTTASEAEARSIARLLVEQRLAACVQISGPIHSVYRWQGEIVD